MEPKGNNVLTTKVTTNQSEFQEAPMEEDYSNEPGDKVNDSDNSVLTNIKSGPSGQDDEISKGEKILII